MFDVSGLNVDLPRFRAVSAKGYLIATAIMLVATILRVQISPALEWLPYVTFFPAVVIITLVCGGAAGTISALASIALVWLFFMPNFLTFENAYKSAMFAIGTGAVILVAGAVRHATALVRNLNATLQQSEAKFRGLLEAAPDAMVIVDDHGKIALVNAATEKLFDYHRSQLLGQPAEMLMRRTEDGELLGMRSDGDSFPIEVSHSPLQTQDGPMVSSAIRDITARKQIEAELTRASRAKSDFLSGMSHELRTPLNAVVGFAELLQMKGSETLSAKQEDYVSHILEGGNHLLVLVTQLLDLAGIEAGRLNLSLIAVDVGAVMRYVHGLMTPLAQKAGVGFALSTPTDTIDVMADELRLRQVLINFVSNAIKYNHAGGHVWLTAQRNPQGGMRFAVSDTGVGIPAEREDELFKPFNRLGAEHSEVSGSGIGLAFSRKIVEAMGGTVGFESEIGEGSTFWVDLPVASVPVSKAAPGTETCAPLELLDGDEALA